MVEEWKFLPGAGDKYLVSNMGIIKSKRENGEYIELAYNKCGGMYWHFHYRLPGQKKHKWFAVHRAVALTHIFNPDPSTYIQVNHIDGNKLNNKADNLEWVTPQQNILHARDVLSVLKNILSIQQANEIRKRVLNDEFEHIRDIVKEYNAPIDVIRGILDNTTYKDENSYKIEIPTIKFKNKFVKQLREEYNADLTLSIRQLAKRHGLNEHRLQRIIRNELYYDPNYTYSENHKYVYKHEKTGKYKKITSLEEADEYIGKTFNWLTILKYEKTSVQGNIFVRCKCKCGKEDIFRLDDVINNYYSCCRNCIKENRRLYLVWRNIKNMCESKSSTRYKKCGEKGIKVCQEWSIFTGFLEWSSKTGYDKNAKRGDCILHRIDANKDFCPENCIWTNLKQASWAESKSGYTGIFYCKNIKSKPWSARIYMNKKYVCLGSFATKKEAVEARNKYIIDNNLTEYKIQEWKDE